MLIGGGVEDYGRVVFPHHGLNDGLIRYAPDYRQDDHLGKQVPNIQVYAVQVELIEFEHH